MPGHAYERSEVPGGQAAPLPGVEDEQPLLGGQGAGWLLGLLGKATSATGLLKTGQFRVECWFAGLAGIQGLVVGRFRPGRKFGSARNRARCSGCSCLTWSMLSVDRSRYGVILGHASSLLVGEPTAREGEYVN